MWKGMALGGRPRHSSVGGQLLGTGREHPQLLGLLALPSAVSHLCSVEQFDCWRPYLRVAELHLPGRQRGTVPGDIVALTGHSAGTLLEGHFWVGRRSDFGSASVGIVVPEFGKCGPSAAT